MSHGKKSAFCGIRQQLGSGMLITEAFFVTFTNAKPGKKTCPAFLAFQAG